MDEIFIRDLRVRAIVGIYPQERVVPQEVLLNITLYADTRQAAQTDDLADCVDYEQAAHLLKQHVESAQRRTVEALAGDLAGLCLSLPGVRGARVRVEKTQAIPFAAGVGVEIERWNA
ncbi:MAG: dihydroneopterin aldolase [Anaerolineales bacterium]|nr:dihydroneopterin aldolase [Anaerolineales bacterium]MCX7755343.1 dihydroneopterin aldolase [Anaerolineales bacterium]MDW8279128.1 dihydroneopterin aldolase [Anaerolineales bacterium]